MAIRELHNEVRAGSLVWGVMLKRGGYLPLMSLLWGRCTETRIHLCRSNGYSDLYFHTVEGQEGLH